jgi:hypothetical protein
MEHVAYLLEQTRTQSRTKTSRSAGSSKASGITNGTSSLLGGGSMRNRSSLSPNRRQTRKQNPNLLFFPFPQRSRIRNQDGQRAMKKSEELRSGESYGSVNVRPHVHIISSSIRYRKSANESKTNPQAGKALA